MAVQSIGADGYPEPEVRFPTPGPVSTGQPDVVAKQRADMGLPPMNDDGTAPEAPPAEVKADETTAPVASDPIEPLTPMEKEATAPDDDQEGAGQVQTKVVEPPAQPERQGTEGAQTEQLIAPDSNAS